MFAAKCANIGSKYNLFKFSYYFLVNNIHNTTSIMDYGTAIVNNGGSPLLRFGVVADVQYADNDDKQAWYNPSKTRFYRNSLKQVEKAFRHWEKLESDFPVTFILQLGDIIDALNTSACSHTAIDRTLSCFLNNPTMPTFHTVGNHELYNFNREQISYLFDKYLFQHSHSEHSFGLKNPKVPHDDSHPLYYKFSPIKGIKFISLDSYDISVLGHEEGHRKYQLASDVLQKYHGHTDFELWDSDKMLIGPEKRFQSSNGALSVEQLEWLEKELEDSDQKNETVVVFGHVGLHPQSCGWDSLLWNYDQVIECFNAHSCVAAYFSGHAHNSGYAFENNIHYVVFHGVIETEPGKDAFATVTLYEDKMHIDGRGVEQELTLPLNRIINTAAMVATNTDGERQENCFEECVDNVENIEEVHVVEIEVEV